MERRKILVGLLAIQVVVVCTVWATDLVSDRDRSLSRVERAHKIVNVIAETSKEALECKGLEGFPPKSQEVFQTLDCYVINQHGFLTNPRYWPNAVKDGVECETQQAQNGLAGFTGQLVGVDYRGSKVIAGYTPVTLPDGVRGVVLVEIDYSEAGMMVQRPLYWFDEILVTVLAVFAVWGSVYVAKNRERIADELSDRPDYMSMVIKLVRQFPDSSGGIALVKPDGIICDCSSGFSRILGGFGTMDVVKKSVHDFHPNPERHRAMFESFTTDLIERPVTFVDLEKRPVDALLSVTRLNGHFLVRLRKPEVVANAG